MGGRGRDRGVDPGDLNGVVRASVKRRVPVVLTAAEVQADHDAAQPSGGSAGPACQLSGGDDRQLALL